MAKIRCSICVHECKDRSVTSCPFFEKNENIPVLKVKLTDDGFVECAWMEKTEHWSPRRIRNFIRDVREVVRQESIYGVPIMTSAEITEPVLVSFNTPPHLYTGDSNDQR